MAPDVSALPASDSVRGGIDGCGGTGAFGPLGRGDSRSDARCFALATHLNPARGGMDRLDARVWHVSRGAELVGESLPRRAVAPCVDDPLCPVFHVWWSGPFVGGGLFCRAGL